jgi:GNAT superfamily N-acetyltransferase
MRTELELYPINACDSREELINKSDNIYIYESNDILIGSIAILKNEIDELIIAKEYQKKGYGRLLLNFAVATIQERQLSPITL